MWQFLLFPARHASVLCDHRAACVGSQKEWKMQWLAEN